MRKKEASRTASNFCPEWLSLQEVGTPRQRDFLCCEMLEAWKGPAASLEIQTWCPQHVDGHKEEALLSAIFLWIASSCFISSFHTTEYFPTSENCWCVCFHQHNLRPTYISVCCFLDHSGGVTSDRKPVWVPFRGSDSQGTLFPSFTYCQGEGIQFSLLLLPFLQSGFIFCLPFHWERSPLVVYSAPFTILVYFLS